MRDIVRFCHLHRGLCLWNGQHCMSITHTKSVSWWEVLRSSIDNNLYEPSNIQFYCVQGMFYSRLWTFLGWGACLENCFRVYIESRLSAIDFHQCRCNLKSKKNHCQQCKTSQWRSHIRTNLRLAHARQVSCSWSNANHIPTHCLITWRGVS